MIVTIQLLGGLFSNEILGRWHHFNISAIWRMTDKQPLLVSTSTLDGDTSDAVEVLCVVVREGIDEENVESGLVEPMAIGVLISTLKMTPKVCRRSDTVLDEGAQNPPPDDVLVDGPASMDIDDAGTSHCCIDCRCLPYRKVSIHSVVGSRKARVVTVVVCEDTSR